MMSRNEFNPQKNRFQKERFLIFVEKGSVLGSSIATSGAVLLAAYILVKGFIGDFYIFGINGGEVVSIIACIAAAVIAALVTDIAFSSFLKDVVFKTARFFYFKWGKIPKGENFTVHFIFKPFIFILEFILLSIILWFDIFSIKTSDRPVQTFAKQNTELDVAGEQQKAAKAISSTDFSDRIKQLESSISAKEKSFRNSARGLALQKIVNDDPKNGWAKGQIEAGIAAATAADRSALAAVNKKQDALTVKNRGIFEETAKQILDKNKKITEDNAASRQSVSTIFNFFGITMKVISILIAIWLVISFCINHPNYDANNDGKVDHEDVNASFQ